MAIKSALVVSIALLADIACAHASGCYQYKPVRGHAEFAAAFTACTTQTSMMGFASIGTPARSNAMDACMRSQGWRSVRISAVDCPAPD